MIPSDTKRFGDLDLLTDIDSSVSLIGIKQNEDGSFTDFRFKPEQSSLPEAEELTGDEHIVILQGGEKRKLTLSNLISYINGGI